MTKKRRYDLRDFWPWYERYLPTAKRPADPPPFGLREIHKDEPLPRWERRFWQILSLAVCFGGLTFVLWNLFRP